MKITNLFVWLFIAIASITLTSSLELFSSAHAQIGGKCKNDQQCNDDKFCNGVEKCRLGRCVRGSNPCTEGQGMTCSESEKKCVERMCTQDFMCGNDNQWCNGREVCRPDLGKGFFSASYGSGHWGCHRVEKPCPSGCVEETRTCQDSCSDRRVADRDGDGHVGIHCGGTDCDDDDDRIYPGATEVCDSAGVDEDCDPKTLASRDGDRDGDGEISVRCCNTSSGGDTKCGTDCDDTKAVIVQFAQSCPVDGGPDVNVCGWGVVSCGQGKVCHAQPNGTGVCSPL